jgi:hypothetical protein
MHQLYRPVGHAEVDEIPPHDFGVGRVIFDKENNNRLTTHGVSLPFFDGLSCQFPRNLLVHPPTHFVLRCGSLRFTLR